MKQALGMWQASKVQYVLRVWQPLFLWCYGCVMSLADVSGTSCFGGVVSAWPLRPIIAVYCSVCHDAATSWLPATFNIYLEAHYRQILSATLVREWKGDDQSH